MPDDVAAAQTGLAAREGFTAEGLAALDRTFHGLVDEGQLAGVVTLVARHGRIVHLDACGTLDLGAQAPVQADSIFRIASMTKPIIGAAMMMLWEEGKWALDDPVARHIPEFEGLKVKAKGGEPVAQASPMTLRQLMSHTAGFGRLLEHEAANLRGGDLQDMIDKLARLPLSYQPGTQWRYGPSVDVQGYLVEKLSGQGLDEFLERRLFGPLGMKDTGFWVEAAKAGRLARIHAYKGGRLEPQGDANSFHAARPKFLSGGGGLVSTAPDYWRFAQMILDGGVFEGRRYLQPATVELMHVNVLAPGVEVTLYTPDTRGLGFGMDFAIVLDPALARTAQGVQSYYWGGAFGTWFWIDPMNDMTVIGFIQNLSGSTPGAGTPPARELSAQCVYAAMTDRRS